MEKGREVSARACGQDEFTKFEAAELAQLLHQAHGPEFDSWDPREKPRHGHVRGRIGTGRLKVKPMAHKLGGAEAGGQL